MQITRARAVRATRLLAIALAVGLIASDLVAFPSLLSDRPAPQMRPPFTTGSLAFLTEVYGNSGPLLDRRLRETLANGASLHQGLDGEGGSMARRDLSSVAGK